jgi:hypothetical protein
VTKSFCNYVRNEDRKIKSLELQLTESNNENNILKDNLIVAKRNTYLFCGATVLVELWPPHVLYVRFHDKFLQGRVDSPTPNPQPGRKEILQN